MKIAGVDTLHRRAVWCPDPFAAPPGDMAAVRVGVIHYAAAESIPVEVEDVAGWLYNIHRWSLARHGWSLVYGWAVDWLGGVWEIRGFDHRNAANLGRHVGGTANRWTASILMITAGDAPATQLAIRSARAILAEHRRRSAATWTARPLAHRDTDPTDCPGSGLLAQLADGLFDHLDPDPDPEDPDMIVIDWNEPPHPAWTAFMWDGIHLAHLGGHAERVVKRVDPRRVTVTDIELDGLIRSSRTTTPPPHTLTAELTTAWTARAV